MLWLSQSFRYTAGTIRKHRADVEGGRNPLRVQETNTVMARVNLEERNWNDRNLWSTTTRGTMKMEGDKQERRNLNSKNSCSVKRPTGKSGPLK
jgi:hypothetical protein